MFCAVGLLLYAFIPLASCPHLGGPCAHKHIASLPLAVPRIHSLARNLLVEMKGLFPMPQHIGCAWLNSEHAVALFVKHNLPCASVKRI